MIDFDIPGTKNQVLRAGKSYVTGADGLPGRALLGVPDTGATSSIDFSGMHESMAAQRPWKTPGRTPLTDTEIGNEDAIDQEFADGEAWTRGAPAKVGSRSRLA